ncbi:putative cysteine ligase BshC [Spirochaetota bacterium]|nr:putative cysteine ligase BshC [Spirochaetota bacterium]
MTSSNSANNRSVVTGQQLGLLGGPLFSIVKLIGAIREAETRNTQAIFWLESHDADFSEANTLTFIDPSHTIHRLQWKKKTFGMPIGTIIIDDDLIAIIETMFRMLPQTAASRAARRLVLACFKVKRNLGAATEELFKHYFKDFKITFFNPYNKAFHEFSKPLLLREAEHTPVDNQCNLFALVDGIRTSVFRSSRHHFTTRTGKPVNLHRHILVPNLKTRSLLQDAYLNVDCYIAGKSEAAYLKNLEPEYIRHHITPATVKKRMFLTLLTPQYQNHLKSLHSLGISLATLKRYPYHDLHYNLIKKRTGLDLLNHRAKLKTEKENFLKALTPLEHKEAISSPMPPSLKKIERLLYKELKHLWGAKRARSKKLVAPEATLLKELRTWVYPFNTEQERIFNWVPLIAEHGKPLLHTIYNQYTFTNKVLKLD